MSAPGISSWCNHDPLESRILISFIQSGTLRRHSASRGRLRTAASCRLTVSGACGNRAKIVAPFLVVTSCEVSRIWIIPTPL
jgi:hypothetical protein